MNIGRKTKYGTIPSVIIAIAIVAMLTVGPILSSKAADAAVTLSTSGDPGVATVGFSQAHIATTSQASVKMTLTTAAEADVSFDGAFVRVVGVASNPLSAVTDGTPLTPLLLNDIISLSVKVFAESQTAGGGGVTPVFEIFLRESGSDFVQIAGTECPFSGGIGICSVTDMYKDGTSASGRATAAPNLGAFHTMKPAQAGDTSLATSGWEMFDPEGINADNGETHTLAEWKAGCNPCSTSGETSGGTATVIGTLEVVFIGLIFAVNNPPSPAPTDSSIVWIDDVEINGVIFHPLSAASFGGESTASFTPRITPSATSSSTD